MPYVEDRVIHDADSHVMEFPDRILEFVEARHLPEFKRLAKGVNIPSEPFEKFTRLHDDPDFCAEAESQLMLRKNYEALGAFRKEDRPRTLDLLGFASQLVFTTDALNNYGLETGQTNALACAAARAHNRMMADFCSVDKRLLATAYVPLVDIEQAPLIAKEALELGCKAITIPSRCPPGHSPSHIGFEPLWSLAEEAGVPILFHVGGERKMHTDYHNNGGPQVLDFHGGAENFTSSSYMSIPLALWETMSVLIIDGVLDRHQSLKFGAIELGASWVPSWMRFLDSGVAAFRRGEERLQKLSATPSEIVRRQFRVTPYPHEPTGWIIENTGPEVCLFSSDYPHIEGGRNPLKRFGDALQNTSKSDQQRFYRDNFIDLMGQGLAAELHG
ncbi:MAG: amidohydrolase family protein [Pseudomonadales bacterium]